MDNINKPTVAIVDDDSAMTESISWLLESDGLHVETYPHAKAFLSVIHQITCHCVLLDIRMPGMSGIELQEQLKMMRKPIPVVFITGHGDVSMAVRAMKLGAADFLIKPFKDQILLEAIHKAIASHEKTHQQHQQQEEIAKRIQTLTPREREVMHLVVNGKLNKTIAIELGIGNKTVEIHRARIMKKMQTRSLAELVKMTIPHIFNHK